MMASIEDCNPVDSPATSTDKEKDIIVSNSNSNSSGSKKSLAVGVVLPKGKNIGVKPSSLRKTTATATQQRKRIRFCATVKLPNEETFPIKKRRFRLLMMGRGDDDDDSNNSVPKPPKLRRLVASFWRQQQQQHGSHQRSHGSERGPILQPRWDEITKLPPSSGSYWYEEHYPAEPSGPFTATASSMRTDGKLPTTNKLSAPIAAAVRNDRSTDEIGSIAAFAAIPSRAEGKGGSGLPRMASPPTFQRYANYFQAVPWDASHGHASSPSHQGSSDSMAYSSEDGDLNGTVWVGLDRANPAPAPFLDEPSGIEEELVKFGAARTDVPFQNNQQDGGSSASVTPSPSPFYEGNWYSDVPKVLMDPVAAGAIPKVPTDSSTPTMIYSPLRRTTGSVGGGVDFVHLPNGGAISPDPSFLRLGGDQTTGAIPSILHVPSEYKIQPKIHSPSHKASLLQHTLTDVYDSYDGPSAFSGSVQVSPHDTQAYASNSPDTMSQCTGGKSYGEDGRVPRPVKLTRAKSSRTTDPCAMQTLVSATSTTDRTTRVDANVIVADNDDIAGTAMVPSLERQPLANSAGSSEPTPPDPSAFAIHLYQTPVHPLMKPTNSGRASSAFAPGQFP
jgi:hypothetical protein